MVSIPDMLLVTTPADYSVGLFQEEAMLGLIRSTVIEYGNLPDRLPDHADIVYLRDPFNHQDVASDQVTLLLKELNSKFGSAYWVDRTKSYADLLIEDKWRQYQLFKEVMPSTVLFDGSELRGRVIKKRISARAKHVYFQRSDLPSNYKPDDHISQTRLDIVRELRIYMIGGNVIKPAVSKTSKTINQKVRLSEVEDNIPEQALDICETVYQATNLDFVGLDIAETSNGCYLLEVNRSCQFKGYKRLTGVNLAVELDEYLLTKLVKNT